MNKSKTGGNIRKLRKERGLTLENLGEMTDLSISYLSMVERDLCPVSLTAISNIAKALEVGQEAIFAPVGKKTKGLVRSYQHVSTKLEDDRRVYDHLVDQEFSPRPFDALRVTILPTESVTQTVPFTHSGEEFVYVFEGVLTLMLDKQSYSLSEGESAHYHSSIPHKWLNLTDKRVVILVINCDPKADYFG